MKIAVAQVECEVGSVQANLAKMEAFAERAQAGDAEWIIFPEMSDTGYVMPVIQEKAQRWDEMVVPNLQRVSRELSLGIIAGLSERADTGEIFNAQVALDRRGEIVAKYRKLHLFAPAPVEEHKVFTAGDEVVSFAIDDFRIGLGICYDLRFPEFFRKLAIEQRTNVFVLSSAWPSRRAEHLRALAIARAIENQSYFVLSNRVGRDGDGAFCGESAVIDPMGRVLASAVQGEELIFAEIDAERIASTRAHMTVLAHRRL